MPCEACWKGLDPREEIRAALSQCGPFLIESFVLRVVLRDLGFFAALDEFVRAGGTLLCFNRASLVAIDALKLPVRNAVAGVNRQEFFVGGSLLNIDVETTSRVMAGMPTRASVFYDSGPVFETQEGFKGTVLARYQPQGSPLASGFLLGEKYLNGKAAALDVELGEGHVVLLGFRPQWRGQPFGSFRMIFNALAMAK